LLDVSTSSSFSSFVGSYQNFVVISNSQVVSGLTANTTYYYRLRAVTGVDADAASFFGRVYTAGGTLSYAEVLATETLVADLKAYGIWSAMKAIYPMVGGGTGTTAARQAACAQNLKSSSFTGTFTSGWTYASTGVTPNGTSAYMDTSLNPSIVINNVNDGHLSYYSRTQSTGNFVDIGTQAGTSAFDLVINYAGIYAGACINMSDVNLFSYTGITKGLFIGSQNNTANVRTYYRDNSFSQTQTIAQNEQTNQNISVGARGPLGNAFYTNRECAFASIGTGLSGTQASNLYTAVQAFNTTLSRNVGAPWYDNGTLLLDSYPSSAAAYSLRKLRNNYIGGPIRVRRSSDNTEQDIYFDANGDIDTAQLLSFVGTGGTDNGFVTTWYDQSGNGRNATQTNAVDQPVIVSGGSVLTLNSKPSVLFSSDYMNISSNFWTYTGDSTVFHASLNNHTSYQSLISYYEGVNTSLGVQYTKFPNTATNVSTDVYAPGGVATNNTQSANIQYLVSMRWKNWSTHKTNGDTIIAINGANQAFTAYGNNPSTWANTGATRIGRFDTSNWSGEIQELVIYTSGFTQSDIDGVESNINTYYAIY
jgi:hypothetical protein